ncbi:MAG TPA: DUF3078 domain-containing protein [Paludibacter sp.]
MKTRITIFMVLICNLFIAAKAQVTEGESKLKSLATDTISGWKKGGATSINLAQTALSNWAGGGENSFALSGVLGLFANYKDTTAVWDNSLDIGYGVLKQGTGGLRKTDDRLEINSKYGKKAFTNFYYAALINFKTQFAPGYNYTVNQKISNFLAPGYLVGAIGLNYQPNSYFSAFLAPFTGRLTIVKDTALSNSGAFGVDPGKSSRMEFGGYARILFNKQDFKGELMKNVSITSKLDLFTNYLKDPQNVDVSWENIIFLKVNKYIVVSLNTNIVYDADVKDPVDNVAKVQFKEILGVGFAYKF